MQESTDPRRPTRLRRTPFFAAALVSGILVGGCGGSSPRPTAATAGGASSSASRSASSGAATTAGSTNPAAATSARSTAPGPGGSAVAFANCMRANGVPNFPDPKPGSGTLFQIPAGASPAAPAFKAAQAKCQRLLPGGGLPDSGAPPSAQTLAKLLKIARCMRQHGVPQFPDPSTTPPSNPAGTGPVVITDFDGAILVFPATINLQSPAYRQALTSCGAPPLGLHH